MGALREKQSRFANMVCILLHFALAKGYEITFGDTYRDPRCSYGRKNSCHRLRLAIDLNLFKDGEYLSKTKDHRQLGEFWESIGGTWGGRFRGRSPDGNHYSLEHNGRK